MDPEQRKGLNMPSKEFFGNAIVRNTFLEFPDADQDQWLIAADPRRQKTDSILQINSSRAEALAALQARAEQGVAAGSDHSRGQSSPYPGSSSDSFVPERWAQSLPCPVPWGSDVGFGDPVDDMDKIADAWHGLPPKTQDWSSQRSYLSTEEPEPTPGHGPSAQELHPTQCNQVPNQFYYANARTELFGGQGNAFEHDEHYDHMAPGDGAEMSIPAYSSHYAMNDGSPSNGTDVHPELQILREIALSGGGLSRCTTVMMRHVPFKYTQRKLMKEINSLGFLAKYDFFYLPMDPRSHANRGFVFLNLISIEAADEFYQKFNNQRLRHFSSDKALSILPADLQGFDENALRYIATNAQRGKRTGHTKPVFFRNLPAHVSQHLGDMNLSDVADFQTHPTGGQRAPPTPHPTAAAKAHCFSTALPAGFVAGPIVRNPGLQQGYRAPISQSATLDAALRAHAAQAQMPLAQSVPLPEVNQGYTVSWKKFCSSCGNPRVPDHVFCPYCGGKLSE